MNETLTKLFDIDPYQLDRVSKENLLMERLRELEEIHQADSKAYSRLATANIFQSNEMNKLRLSYTFYKEIEENRRNKL